MSGMFRLRDLDAYQPVVTPGKLVVHATHDVEISGRASVATGIDLYVAPRTLVSVSFLPNGESRPLIQISERETAMFYGSDFGYSLPLVFVVENDSPVAFYVRAGMPVFECSWFVASQDLPTETRRFPTDFGIARLVQGALKTKETD